MNAGVGSCSFNMEIGQMGIRVTGYEKKDSRAVWHLPAPLKEKPQKLGIKPRLDVADNPIVPDYLLIKK